MATQVISPYHVFFDREGDPLESGFIFIGSVNQNPEINPIPIFWDEALTIPIAQPVRTLGGYPSRSGTPGIIYVGTDDFSITVRDKKSNLVFTSLSATTLSSLQEDLANDTDPNLGAGMIGYKGETVYDWMNEREDVLFEKAFGVLRNNVADDSAALTAALAAASATGKILISGPGTALVANVPVPSNVTWIGNNSILKLPNATDASILVNSSVVGGNENIIIDGFELDGNRLNQGAISRPVALFKNCDRVILRRVKAHDAKITTYMVDTYDQILFVDCNYCEVDHCESYSQPVAGGLGFYGTGGNHRVMFNHVHDCVAGIEGTYQTDSHVFGNVVENSDVGLISWNGLRNIIYKNRCFDSSGGAGIVCGHSGTPDAVANGSFVIDNTISDVFSYGVTVFASSDVTVEGNKITRVAGDATHSIFINTGCTQIYVRNNSIRDYVTSTSGAAGIFVDGCSDIDIIGNKIYGATGNTTGNGIRLFNACPNANISNNTVVDSVANGINISEASSTNCTINNNKVRTSGTIGIRTMGAGAVVVGNSVLSSSGAQGILINADQGLVTGNRVSGVLAGSGIFLNAIDFNVVAGNVIDNCATGISVPSGADNSLEVANVMTSTVTTKITVGTVTGNKIAHNIGLANHDV